jgi:hypothetical protein
LYGLSFCLLAIVLSVLLSFGHCIVCPSVFWPLYGLSFCLLAIVLSVPIQWPKDRRTDHTMAKRQKDRPYNGQKTEGQTIQWPKDKRTDHTMAKRQKDRPFVWSVLLSFGHCMVCPSVFWPLYCLSFCLLAIVLSVLLKLKVEQHKPHQYQGKTQVLRKGKQFLFH